MNRDTSSASSRQPGCACATRARTQTVAKWTTVGGLITALGLCAACCLLPFALVTAGIATAWAGTLESLSRYKWLLVLATVALLGFGFYVAYRKPRTTCSADSAFRCTSASTRSLKIGLWVVTALALAGLAFEQIEPFIAKGS